MRNIDHIDNDPILERMSAIYDGENLPQDKLQSDEFAKAREHMQNWSLIGATLRKENFASIDTSFADKISAQISAMGPIANTPIAEEPIVDQAQVEQKPKVNYVVKVRKAFFVLAQVAAAAAIAAVTVVGYQTYNAGSITDFEPAVNANFGPVGGDNLASYQNDNQDMVIRMNQFDSAQNANVSQVATPQNQADPQAIRDMREKELEKINIYLRGYVLDTATNR